MVNYKHRMFSCYLYEYFKKEVMFDIYIRKRKELMKDMSFQLTHI